MYQIIRESLNRQDRALALLHELLEEEYQTLMKRDASAIAGLEFSIQELIRQLAVEKSLVIRNLDGRRVLEYAKERSEEERAELEKLFAGIDASEQLVSRQASRNAQLSLGLLDQSTFTLQALTSEAAPPRAGTYGRKGGMCYELHPQAALISGRL